MKVRKFLLLALVLSLILCAMFVTVSAADIVDSGKCGDNLTWTLDSSGTLTISGTGDMYDYENNHGYPLDVTTPWFSHRNKIRNVVVNNGVTSIGANSFAYCENIVTIDVPASITKIGDGAFAFDPGNWDGAYWCGWENYYCIVFHGSKPQISVKSFLEDGDVSSDPYYVSYRETYGIHCFYPADLWDKPVDYKGAKWAPQDDMSSSMSGPLEDDARWHWDSNGTLTISGTGPAWHITDGYPPVWKLLGLQVDQVIIEPGITRIGWLLLANSEMTKISLPNTLDYIYSETFANCKNLTSITIPSSVKKIGGAAFYGCTQLETVIFRGDAPQITDSDYGAPFSNIQAKAVCPANNSTWTAKVKTKLGSKLIWSENVPLAITTQPKTSYFKMGDEVVMSVAAEGAGLSYQWYYNMNAGKGDFIKSSVTGPTYRTTMNASTKDRMVRCVITDAYGNSVTSNQVTMRLAATITEQPTDVHVAAGKMATVQLTAVGDGLTYTWYQAPAGSSNFTKTSSFTGNTYKVEMNSSRDGRQLYCVVKDWYGKTHKSDVVTINMIKPPAITTQPKTNYTKRGDTATMTIEAEGDGLTYQWYYKNAGAADFIKSAVTGPVYSTTMNSSVKDRMVYCIVTNKHGASIKSNQVTLRMAATITKQPVNASAAVGKKVSVKLSAVGDGLTYTWYYKNAGATKFSKSSVTSSTYSTTMNTTVDGRQIYCVVKDWYGKTHKSDTVTIGITAKITKQPTTGYAANGSTVKVSTKASGDGLTYTWYYKNAGATTYSKSSLTSATYSTTMNPTVRNRQVYCVIRDMYGNELKTDTVTLRMTASITTQPKDTIAASGRKVSTKVSALGDGLTYTWYYKNAGATKFVKSSLTSATYSTTMNSTVDRRQVYCVVTDKYGYSVKSSTATLYME